MRAFLIGLFALAMLAGCAADIAQPGEGATEAEIAAYQEAVAQAKAERAAKIAATKAVAIRTIEKFRDAGIEYQAAPEIQAGVDLACAVVQIYAPSYNAEIGAVCEVVAAALGDASVQSSATDAKVAAAEALAAADPAAPPEVAE